MAEFSPLSETSAMYVKRTQFFKFGIPISQYEHVAIATVFT
jgi:hypothetical protein